LAESRLEVKAYSKVCASVVSATARDSAVVYGVSLSCTFARTVTGTLAWARKLSS
jgi:hypothetical protein